MRYFVFYLVFQHYFSIFAAEFATLIAVLCRTKVRNNYVYTRKRKLDKLPLGHFSGVTSSGESIPYAGLAIRQAEFVGF